MLSKNEMIYEGKAKQIYSTSDPDLLIVHYKDDATAFNGAKKAQISGKGIYNNKISTIIFQKLEREGIETHFIEQLNERDQLCKKVKIIPLEFIVRNVIAGSMAKRLDIEEGTVPPNIIFELCYKNDFLNDPLINDDHAVAIGLVSYEEIQCIREKTLKINSVLKHYFEKSDIRLIDFKIELGKDQSGKILLADEISPDTCRFWDKKNDRKMDKDRFRRDLGDVENAYKEILERLQSQKA